MKKIGYIFMISLLIALLFIAPVAAETLIVHTNDVHGRLNDNIGYDGLAAFVQECKDNGDDVILVDAGDAFQGLVQVNYFMGKSAADLMDKVGYAVMVPGNNDFYFGVDNLKDIAGNSSFSLVASNLFSADTNEPVFEKSAIISSGGKKYGFFGISFPLSRDDCVFLNGEDMYAIAQNTADMLRKEGCDYVICLAHLGVNDNTKPDRSIDLAQHLTGVDVIIDGHSHTELPDGLRENSILIASTGCYLKNIGVVHLNETGSSAELISDYQKKDSKITKEIAACLDAINNVYGEKIGVSSVVLNGERNPGVRTQETNLGDFVCDAILKYANNSGYAPDCAFLEGAMIRASLPSGDITKLDVLNVVPYDIQLVVIQVPGNVLLHFIEDSTFASPEESPGFFQVSGIGYNVDTSKPYVKHENHRVTIQSVGGEPFDEDKDYVAVLDEMHVRSMKNYDDEVEVIGSLDSGVNDMVITYISNTLDGVIDEEYAQPKGRITMINTSQKPENMPAKSPVPFAGIVLGLGTVAGLLLCRNNKKGI